jgi:hypothetical protein
MRRIELPARWATSTCLSIRLHPPGGQTAPKCIREVPTLRLPRCERGALPLSYGCVECAGRARGTVPLGITSTRSARLVSNEAFRCIRAASSPADSGPYVCRWTQGISEARPPACRAGALPLSYVSVVVMGGFDPPPRAFQARALPTELHDHGAGPGTRTRITWVTKPAPIPLGPAGMITPRRPAALLHRIPRGAAATCRNPA